MRFIKWFPQGLLEREPLNDKHVLAITLPCLLVGNRAHCNLDDMLDIYRGFREDILTFILIGSVNADGSNLD